MGQFAQRVADLERREANLDAAMAAAFREIVRVTDACVAAARMNLEREQTELAAEKAKLAANKERMGANLHNIKVAITTILDFVKERVTDADYAELLRRLKEAVPPSEQST
jgi:hypothetical protein